LVLSVLRSGQLAQGAMVARFESLCAAMAETQFAVAMTNGTVTLEAIFEALEIGPGDEVITTPVTFAATVNAILRSGATVRFADIAADHTLDPASVEALIGPRTRAIVPVHLYGLMADMHAFGELASRHNLALVEDAAQAHGARDRGRAAGSVGIGSFSFYATKNVTAGEGGAVTTSDEGLARHLRMLRNQGMAGHYDYQIVGRNLRLTDLQAAVAIPQLEQLESINRRRSANARQLTELLNAELDIEPPRVPEARSHVWHQYTVLLPADVDRRAVMATMREHGVIAGLYYPRLAWNHDAYRDHPGVVVGETPRAADVVSRCLSLPVHDRLEPEDIERIAAVTVAATVRHRVPRDLISVASMP
jgi:dTDP-4-amino-4,6-dideoxygalactose transaminase